MLARDAKEPPKTLNPIASYQVEVKTSGMHSAGIPLSAVMPEPLGKAEKVFQDGILSSAVVVTEEFETNAITTRKDTALTTSNGVLFNDKNYCDSESQNVPRII